MKPAVKLSVVRMPGRAERLVTAAEGPLVRGLPQRGALAGQEDQHQAAGMFAAGHDPGA
jgi:hypothetical protein